MMMPIMLSARNKDRKVLNSPLSMKMVKTANGVIIPSEGYLLELYDVNDITIGLIANANFGNLPTQHDDAGICMSAVALANIDLILTDQEFHFKQDQGVSYTGTRLLDLFGKVHDMSITTEEEGTVEYRFYIPELIAADISNADSGVKRTESVLHWNPDSQYPTKVLVAYILYNSTSLRDREMLYRDAVIVDDNGQLDLSGFLNNQDAKCIELSIYRINAIEVNTEGKRIALAFTTVDHHIYAISD